MNYKNVVTAVMAFSVAAASAAYIPSDNISLNEIFQVSQVSAADSVAITENGSGFENAYVEWEEVSGASGYNVYYRNASGSEFVQLDTQLIRKYPDGWRADAVGLVSGNYSLKVIPVINGSEDTSKAAETVSMSVEANDRSGFGWVDGSSSGAYNDDGTLKENAVVLYVTEDTKDTVSLDVVTNSKGASTNAVGIQNILNLYKKGYDSRPLDIRVIGTVTDPSVLEGGDLVVSGNGDSKRLSCGITIEGIGEDALFNGFGIRLKNVSNMEIRNMGIMLVDSGEGDNYSLQQSCDHIWVHNCDSFYGMAGGDADQAKGDGALDCKKSTYITFSYNHFWDNGKCNLLGLSEGTTDGLYITYHHNWYDHSDSRHPRVRYYTAHVYNNYYDGNAKYGIGSTMGSSIFSENNYFRNCKYPMLISMQGSDIAEGVGTFSKEDGGIIKSFGNYIEGGKSFVPYSENNTEFDAYVASSRDEQVPSSVTSKKGGNTYNNFDTSSDMYSYKLDAAEDVPSVVTSKAGRLNGGDFKWTFNNAVDDESYSVNSELMAALKSYKTSLVSVGGNSVDGTGGNADPVVTTEVTAVTTTETTTSKEPEKTTVTTKVSESPAVTTPPSISDGAIYCSPDGTGDGTSKESPTSVLNAISSVKAGQTIYLLGGTYKFSETILIEQNNSGSAGAYKTVMAYPGESVVWDFSGQGEADASKRGVVLDGSYWKFIGFEITKAADNGMLLSGNNNIIEMMVFNDNQDTGLQISRYRTDAATIAEWPSNNLIKNCTSKNNCDDKTMENADGFAAKLTCGEGNVFDGCMSYNNSDDGWDLFAKDATGPIGVVTIKNCIAFRNGYTEFGEGYGDCDGNGFKLGGSGVGSAHIVENCLAFENLHCGFTDNNNPKLESLTNCTSFNNNFDGSGKPNFSLYRCIDDGCDFKNIISYYNSTAKKASNDKFVGTMENSVYYNSKYHKVTDKVNVTNGYKEGEVVTISDSDFESVTAPEMGSDFHTAWRNADGSINVHGFMQLKSDSSFTGLGAEFESSSVEPPVTEPVTTTVSETTTAKVSETTPAASESESPAVTTTPEESVTAKPSDTSDGGNTGDVLLGDVNTDGSIDVVDVTALKQAILKLTELTPQQAINANVVPDEKDGIIDVKDLGQLLKYIIKVIDKF